MLNRNHIALDILPSCFDYCTELNSVEETAPLAFRIADQFIKEAEKKAPKILIEFEGEVWKIDAIDDTQIRLSQWQVNGFIFSYITLEQFFNAFGKALRGGK
jgi:hypothetical protein